MVIGTGVLSVAAAGLAIAGTAQACVADVLLRRFLRHPAPDIDGAAWPAISVLKPLHGDEPMLEEALASFCAQDYAPLQIVFGVHAAADSAVAVVTRLRARFAHVDIALVVDPARHGPNRKVDNLINMLPHARHDILVISDADIHAAPDMLRSVAAALASAGAGLATTLYTGRPASRSLPRLLGAAGINQAFLPGALMGRALGRQDCLGAVMAIRRATLAAVGGFAALSPHLADDAELGRKVRALGLQVALATSVPATSVVEERMGELYQHELRWGRTVRGQAPIGYKLSAVQAPLAWSILAILAAGPAVWSLAAFIAVWVVRAAVARDLERRLCGGAFTPFWLLPIRDVLSLAVIVASHAGGKVAWRGQTLHISPERNLHTQAAADMTTADTTAAPGTPDPGTPDPRIGSSKTGDTKTFQAKNLATMRREPAKPLVALGALRTTP